MYRCPRCNVELSPDARYCPRCGFNQTNARMQKVAPQQAARSNTPITPTPATPAPSLNPDPPIMHPPTSPVPPAPSLRSSQPGIQPAITPRLTPDMPTSVPPSSPSLGIRKQMSPAPEENIPQQENKEVASPNSLRPVRTNTPPMPGKMTPPPPSRQGVSQPGQPVTVPTNPTTPASEGLANQATSPAQKSPADADIDTEQLSKGAANAQRLSLTKRYMSEQETKHQPTFPVNNAPTAPKNVPPARQMPNETMLQRPDMTRGAGAAPTMPPPQLSPIFDPFTGEGAESRIATSKAAEHWRQSWRDRQHDEAGPAVGITRGQADVPEPLMAMQQSIARMRAIIIPKNTSNTGKNFGFWVTLILLLCIIGGLCAYIISTYAPSAQLAAQISNTGGASPTLAIKGTHTSTIKAGQTFNVHGTYFGQNHAITFILDTTPLSTSQVQSNDKGTFDASLTIPATWLTGNYALQALDNKSGLHAFLDLQILPGTQVMSNNTSLVLTMDGQPLPTTGLKFQTVMGSNSLTSQRITITNTGNASVQWNASAQANNNLNWLVINDGKTGGTLDIQGTDSIGISVNSLGLTSSTKPYLGSFILTIDQTQAIIPVSLTVHNTSLEVVVNPNPVIAYLKGNGVCQPVTLTLINLSDQVVTWNANPYDADKPHIHLDNQTNDQGTLDPSGLPNDTKAIQITCIGAQVGEKLYHISVYYNGIPVNVPVTVRFA